MKRIEVTSSKHFESLQVGPTRLGWLGPELESFLWRKVPGEASHCFSGNKQLSRGFLQLENPRSHLPILLQFSQGFTKVSPIVKDQSEKMWTKCSFLLIHPSHLNSLITPRCYIQPWIVVLWFLNWWKIVAAATIFQKQASVETCDLAHTFTSWL